jgi:FtsH-binding integral membrane protein
VRIWLKDSERKPDPTPVKTDDRKVVLVGLVLWVLALAGLLLFVRPLLAGGHGFWLWTVVVGITIGLVGLVYTTWRQGRQG